jgi:hypothetical protein
MDDYILKTRDPLSETMTRYLTAKDLSSLSQTNKTFQSISKNALKNEAYRFAQEIAEYEMRIVLRDNSINSKINGRIHINMWENAFKGLVPYSFVADFMKEIYRQRFNQSYTDDI